MVLGKVNIFFFFLLICVISGSENHLQLYLDEVRSLSELPMDKLIQIKSNLAEDIALEDTDFDEDFQGRTAMMPPVALPYRKIDKSIRRYSEWDEKGKDTKISKIFQLAITTLSFLAFGGYLLTLIITAIRRNAAATNGGNVIVFSNVQGLTKYKRPKRNLMIMDPSLNDFDTDRLYQGMLMLSESYASYSKLK